MEKQGTKAPLVERMRAAREAMVLHATAYSENASDYDWRELCRAKATLDALRRCAR